MHVRCPSLWQGATSLVQRYGASRMMCSLQAAPMREMVADGALSAGPA